MIRKTADHALGKKVNGGGHFQVPLQKLMFVPSLFSNKAGYSLPETISKT